MLGSTVFRKKSATCEQTNLTNKMSLKIDNFDLLQSYVMGMLGDYDNATPQSVDRLCWMHYFENLDQYRKFQTIISQEETLRHSVVYGDLPPKFPAFLNSYFVRGVKQTTLTKKVTSVSLDSIGLVCDFDGNICRREVAEQKTKKLAGEVCVGESRKRKEPEPEKK